MTDVFEVGSFHWMEEKVMDLLSLTQLLGNLGEFFGAIAVVATLIYLAVQVRQNTHALELNRRTIVGQTIQARSHRWSERMERLAESQHVAEIYLELEADGFYYDPIHLSRLDPDQKLRMFAWEHAQMSHMVNVYQQMALGLEKVNEKEFRDAAVMFDRQWRALGVSIVDPGFREFVESGAV